MLSHALSRRRERRKEILDLCGNLKALADEAVEAANEAWLCEGEKDRLLKIHETKGRIQTIGIAATTLRRRSTGRLAGLRELIGRKQSIDVREQVALLRRAATQDPFEEPDRKPDATKLGDIALARSKIHYGLDSAFNDVFG